MACFSRMLLAACSIAMISPGHVAAQDLRIFDSKEALDTEIASHMEAGSFSALVEAIAPPSRMSTGRIRILEQAFAEDIPSLQNVVPLFHSHPVESVSRSVMGWWNGETYVYLGMLTHTREDGVAVLDFLLTADIRRASRWYLSGQPQP